ncbi:MAG: hypothetical protein LBN43_07875 [Oscillospiraceae bacterium]|jgi:hypothetical protein|nr:hypothetical protein [Oscillospiraceae bacterium]
MARLNAKRKPMKLVETAFDILYLGTVLISSVLLYFGSAPESDRRLYGLMEFVLFAGDAFHLLPRIRALWDDKAKDYTAVLGIGKLVASLTMTVFYILLWNIGVSVYGETGTRITPIIYSLCLVRFLLCLIPQNQWTLENPPLKWAILRNIPFFIIGLAVTALFAAGSLIKGGVFPFLWIAVIVSFACYLPVVLFAGRNAKVGMLMLPKSCAYAAIVLMGFSL